MEPIAVTLPSLIGWQQRERQMPIQGKRPRGLTYCSTAVDFFITSSHASQDLQSGSCHIAIKIATVAACCFVSAFVTEAKATICADRVRLTMAKPVQSSDLLSVGKPDNVVVHIHCLSCLLLRVRFIKAGHVAMVLAIHRTPPPFRCTPSISLPVHVYTDTACFTITRLHLAQT